MADDRKPTPGQDAQPDPWASRRRRNIATVSVIFALAALFFLITILRMG